MHLSILTFCCHQLKIQKMGHFLILVSESSSIKNMITKKMTPFFSSTLWALSVCMFHFCISRPSKFSSLCLIFVLISKIRFYMPKMPLSKHRYPFSRKMLRTFFWYILYFVPNLIPVCFRSYRLQLITTKTRTVKAVPTTQDEN